MRPSSICLAAVLLFSSVTFAQHQNSSTAPSTPAPAPSPAPAMHSAPSAPAPSSMTSAPSASPSHTFTPSAPSASSAPAVHVAPTVSSSGGSVRETAPAMSKGNSTESVTRAKGPATTPATEPAKAVSGLRLGESQSEKGQEAKPVESDLRKRICEGGPCKESAPQAPPPETTSIRRCLGSGCECPPGQSLGKGGCVASVTNPTASRTQDSCVAGTSWNGASCVASNDCPAGMTWNGAQCTSIMCPAGQVRRGASCQADCSAANARTAGVIPEVRSARQARNEVCRQSLSSMTCQQADSHYQAVLAEYRGLLTGVPIECQATLPVPETL